jgi:hypothetical protein
MSIRKAIPFVIAMLAGSLYAYFAVSFFSAFYTSLFSFILLSILFSALFQLVAFFLVGEIVEIIRLKWRTEMAGLLVLLLAGGLAAATLGLCWQFPTLYNRRLLFMDGMDTLVFAGATLLSAGAATTWLVRLTSRGDALLAFMVGFVTIWPVSCWPPFSLSRISPWPRR